MTRWDLQVGFVVAVLTVYGLISSSLADGACCTTGASIQYSPAHGGPVRGGEFGKSVMIDDSVLVVGEHSRSVGLLERAGEIHVYRWDGTSSVWDFSGSVRAFDPSADDLYGHDVDVDGQWIISGANRHTNSDNVPFAGMAEIVQFSLEFNQGSDSWELIEEHHWILEPPVYQAGNPGESGNGEEFGHSVAIDGKFAIVTSHKYDQSALVWNVGRAYVYEHQTGVNELDPGAWVCVDVVSAPTEVVGASYEFGWSVAMDGEMAVIGAPGDPNMGTSVGEAGFAFVYQRDENGDYERLGPALQAVSPAENDHFGKAVDIEGQRIAVGAPGPLVAPTSPPGQVPGAAYVFEVDSADPQNVLIPCVSDVLSPCSELMDDLRMGWSISLAGETLLVGARDRHTSSGAVAHLFRRNVVGDWSLLRTIDGVEGSGDTADQTGWDVAVSDGRVVVTDATLSGGPGSQVGIGAIYSTYSDLDTRATCDCPADVTLDLVIDMDDVTVLLGNWGTCLECWGSDCEPCLGDLDSSGVIDEADLVAMFDAYGPCDDQGAGTPPASIVDCMARYTECPRLCSCIEAVLLVNTP